MPEGQLSMVFFCRKAEESWLIQALVNVGRNYNGPKVSGSTSVESERTRTVIEKDKQLIKKISWTILATCRCSNASAVHTWLTRDQRQAPHLRKKRAKIESFLGVQKSEVPCRVSSDAHEWRNDWETVSGTSSVKIQYRWRCRFGAVRRKDPMKLYCSLILSMFLDCVEYMGDFEAKISVFVESTVQYHTFGRHVLT